MVGCAASGCLKSPSFSNDIVSDRACAPLAHGVTPSLKDFDGCVIGSVAVSVCSGYPHGVWRFSQRLHEGFFKSQPTFIPLHLTHALVGRLFNCFRILLALKDNTRGVSRLFGGDCLLRDERRISGRGRSEVISVSADRRRSALTVKVMAMLCDKTPCRVQRRCL